MSKNNNDIRAQIKMALGSGSIAAKFANPSHTVTGTMSTLAPATTIYDEVNNRPAAQ